MKTNQIIQGDALTELKKIPDNSIDCVVTSPPYFGLRDYGVRGQSGMEKDPLIYVRGMVKLFRQVRRVLKKDGTVWLNLGDTYANRSRPGLSSPMNRDRRKAGKQKKVKVPAGWKSKDLCGIPWRVALALQKDGWYLRQDIIWHKPNPMPESVNDRCTKSHEYIFLLSKNSRYYFDADAIKEPSTGRAMGNGHNHPGAWGQGDEPRTAVELQTVKHRKMGSADKRIGGSGTGLHGHSGNKLANGTILEDRNKRSVWSVGTKPFKGAHFATFPEALIEPMILAGCPRGGVCLDPFMGAGTTAIVALKHGRKYLGIDLSKKYIKMANERINAVTLPML